MLKWLKRICSAYMQGARENEIPFLENYRRDPARHCPVHLNEGCSHVDGIGCDMNDCDILKRYRAGKGV